MPAGLLLSCYRAGLQDHLQRTSVLFAEYSSNLLEMNRLMNRGRCGHRRDILGYHLRTVILTLKDGDVDHLDPIDMRDRRVPFGHLWVGSEVEDVGDPERLKLRFAWLRKLR
jgi:hypothetical protein